MWGLGEQQTCELQFAAQGENPGVVSTPGHCLFGAEEDAVVVDALLVKGLQQLFGGDVAALLTGKLHNDFALFHHDGAVAQLQGGGNVVGNHQTGDVVLRNDPAGQFQHLLSGGGIQCAHPEAAAWG